MSSLTSATFFLPWPDRRLSPNARLHWGAVARVKKKARKDAYYAALAAGLGKLDAERISVRVSYFPPDQRHRDTDNMVASSKSFFDGIADAIGIDDSRWTLTIAPRGPIEKHGMVKIELDWSQAQEEAA